MFKILKEQGLIYQSGESYRLADHEKTSGILATVNPWIAYFNGQFYDIAKDTAKAIHEKSWEANEVIDVMLYGSTLRSESPKDIDLLIIHDGGRLRPFSPYSTLRVDKPVGEENARDSAYSIFRRLGYPHEGRGNDTVVAAIGKRIEALNAGTKTPEEIAEETDDWNRVSREVFNFEDTPDVSNRIDLYGIDNVFDVIVLHIGVLKADANDLVQGKYGTFIKGKRKLAVESCRDPTFWHTILSEGKIYDRAKHDFSLRVEDKYAGAVELFPSK